MSVDMEFEREPLDDPLSALASALSRVVAACCARARIVVAASLAFAALAAVFAANNFEISTDLDALLSEKLAWRADAARLEKAFPDEAEDITVVIDAKTPELAERAAAALKADLAPKRKLFQSVERLNGGDFFDKEGLLYLDKAELTDTTEAMIAAQPILAAVAADPSLRGLLSSLDLGLSGVENDPARQAQVGRALVAIDTAAKDAMAGKPGALSWRSFLSDEKPNPSDWRQFVEILPILDFSSAMPGEHASAAIRDAAKRLNLDPGHGVAVRVTGSVPIADEELATLAESSGPIALLMTACMLVVLYVATRSVKAVTAMLVTILAGGALTSAIGLALFGRFNLVSIAFLPLFFGLGIDFCIQFCARAGAEAEPGKPLGANLPRATLGIGAGLALAAAAIAAGFIAFLPTEYRGVSELGVIAGVGMVIAFALTITLLPALLYLMRAASAPESATRAFKGGDKLIARARGAILLVAVLAGVGACFFLPRLSFDFDPMRLRNPKTEAVAAYYELSRTLDTTPNTISILAPNLDEAESLAARLRVLPEVGEAVTLKSFVPEDQDEKLAIIANARDLLDFSLNPFEVVPAPTDAETLEALAAAEAKLRALSLPPSPLATHVRALADTLKAVAAATPEVRARVQAAVVGGAPTAIAQMSAALNAEPVTLESFPPYLKRLFVSPSGAARIEVSPKKLLLDMESTTQFVRAVQSLAPKAAGDAVTIVESGRTILSAFAVAGVLSAAMISLMLLISLQRWSWTLVTLAPVLLSGALTFATCVLMKLPINLENMIALPLLLGIGVAFNIYFVVAWRAGATALLETSLSRAVLFSALTTGLSFTALTLSAHPGTASMGALLMIGLVWIVLTSLIVTPALLFQFQPREA